MSAWIAVAGTGLTAVHLHWPRSVATIACLVAALLPFVAGLGLAQGLSDQADVAVRGGADLYITARQFGRNVAIPLSAAEEIRGIPGVIDVTPRIVGPMTWGAEAESAVLVGMPIERLPKALRCVAGTLPRGDQVNELVVGTDLAARLRLKVGSVLPPFYHNSQGERLSRVVGLFKADTGLWQARLVFTSYTTAAHIFNQRATATDLLVTCRSGYADQVAAALLAGPLAREAKDRPWRIAVTSRTDAALLLRSGLARREGIFSLHFLVVFAVGIVGVLVTSGAGLTERRREIGILKATGWQTDDVLLRCAVENIFLAIVGAASAVVLAYAWLRWLNGLWIAQVFLAGVDVVPTFPVPFRLTPIPVVLALLLSIVIVLTGSLVSTWRAAIAPPMVAMR